MAGIFYKEWTIQGKTLSIWLISYRDGCFTHETETQTTMGFSCLWCAAVYDQLHFHTGDLSQQHWSPVNGSCCSPYYRWPFVRFYQPDWFQNLWVNMALCRPEGIYPDARFGRCSLHWICHYPYNFSSQDFGCQSCFPDHDESAVVHCSTSYLSADLSEAYKW